MLQRPTVIIYVTAKNKDPEKEMNITARLISILQVIICPKAPNSWIWPVNTPKNVWSTHP